MSILPKLPDDQMWEFEDGFTYDDENGDPLWDVHYMRAIYKNSGKPVIDPETERPLRWRYEHPIGGPPDEYGSKARKI